MNNIQCNNPIDSHSHDRQNFTLDLLRLCSLNNLVSDKKIREIRQCIYSAFKEYAEQFTHRESSTISKKTADLIYSSILFQSDAYLYSLNSIESAIKELNETSFNSIIEKGQNLILDIHQECFAIFKIAFKNRLSIPLYEYQYAMNKSFDEYVKNYSARFDARNCFASIDYPLLGCPAYNMKSQGALFIHEYYSGLMCENLFCKLFDERAIEELLIGYGEIYDCRYNQMLFNISEVILNNLLLAGLLNKKPLDFSLYKDDLLSIEEKYALATQSEIERGTSFCFEKYSEIFRNDMLFSYLKRYISTFAGELHLHLKNNTLQSFAVLKNK